MGHDTSDVDFKHDTDNLTAFTITFFAVTGVMFVIALSLLVFRVGRNLELDRKVFNNPSTRDAAMIDRADKRLFPQGAVRDSDEGVSTTWNQSIDDSMESVIRRYSRR